MNCVGSKTWNPVWIIRRFQKPYRQNSQIINHDAFCRLPVTSAQCNFGTEKNSVPATIINHNGDDYSQVYTQIKEAFRALTKNDIPQPYISDDDFRSSNAGGDVVRYNCYVFDIQYQQSFTAAQPIKVEPKLEGTVPNNIYMDLLWF